MTTSPTAEVTLVLVHGAFHGPWAWDRLVAELGAVPVRRVELSSSGHDPARLGDLSADAEAVRAVVADVGGPVVVCAHSYGGCPTSEGAADLPDVVGLVYLCAFQLDVGESLADAVGGGGEIPDWWDLHAEEGYLDALRPAEIFYGDVDEATATAAAARLGHQALSALGQASTKAAWRTVPSTYVVCERDRAIPVVAQEAMAQRATRVVRMDTSHSPFLSRPGELADLLREELARAAEGLTRTAG